MTVKYTIEEAAKVLAASCEEGICSGAYNRIVALELAAALGVASGKDYEVVEATADWDMPSSKQ